MHRNLALSALALELVGCAIGSSNVTRVADGVAYEGRFISPEAYATYARASLEEARGDFAAALVGYEAALAEDPDAPEILVRIGALCCRVSRARNDGFWRRADEALSRARELDPDLAIAWEESARCAARRAQKKPALEASLRAARLDPESARLQLLVADSAERAGDLELARTYLDALVTRSPESREGWQALHAFARRHADASRKLRAESALPELGAAADREAELRQALGRKDLTAARRLASALGLRPGELAVRAAEIGSAESARIQADLVLDADPGDADAWVAALVIADLDRDAVRFEELLARAPLEPANPPSPAARKLLDDLLERRAGAARPAP